MRSYRTVTATLVITLFASVWVTGHDRLNVNTSTGSDDVRRCSDLDITFDGKPALTDEETLTAPAGSGTVLTVRPPQNGGMYVVGAPRRDFSVTSCEAVAPGQNAGRELLSGIRTSIQNGMVSTTGLPDRHAVVNYIIEAPAGSALDLSAHNGPISLREFSGRSTVRTRNGPVKLLNVTGQVEAHAENGPIRFAGGSGDIDLKTQNGPIGVLLTGDRWAEGSLTARAENGPMQLAIPAGYSSGVRVESSQHSPWSCKGAACSTGRKSWQDDSRSLELGTGPVLVRVSTVNGPVQVQAAR